MYEKGNVRIWNQTGGNIDLSVGFGYMLQIIVITLLMMPLLLLIHMIFRHNLRMLVI